MYRSRSMVLRTQRQRGVQNRKTALFQAVVAVGETADGTYYKDYGKQAKLLRLNKCV